MEIPKPPNVMWRKYVEICELIKGSFEVFETTEMPKKISWLLLSLNSKVQKGA